MELYCAGQPAAGIAGELGVNLNGVYELLWERGIVRPKSEAQWLANKRARAEA